jgi:pimeloyl-ACP methyl ester carboxylesterase
LADDGGGPLVFAHLNGIDINYEVHGEGTPLLLAHGYTASLESWREQVAPLSARYRLVIYDTRGHGKTSAPAGEEHYGLATDYVADQLALMDHLGIEQAYVGGLSMGGMIAQEFALQHPQRLKGLLLYDTGPGTPMMSRDSAMQQRFAQFRSTLANAARSMGMSAVVDAMRKSPQWAGQRVEGEVPGAVRRHIEGMREMSVEGYLGGAAAMQGWAGCIDRLHTITAPTLVLVGENDNLLSASQVIASKITGRRFVLLRNCMHGSNMWRPDAWLSATLDFLSDVDAGRSVVGHVTL